MMYGSFVLGHAYLLLRISFRWPPRIAVCCQHPHHRPSCSHIFSYSWSHSSAVEIELCSAELLKVSANASSSFLLWWPWTVMGEFITFLCETMRIKCGCLHVKRFRPTSCFVSLLKLDCEVYVALPQATVLTPNNKLRSPGNWDNLFFLQEGKEAQFTLK